MKDPNAFMTGKGEPAWSLPMNRTELIARCESLAADKAELLRILGVADERIKALEALNSRLANDINCGELLTAPETPAKPEPSECCPFCGAAPRNPCDYSYPHADSPA